MADVFDIAKYILEKQNEPMTTMKLQKLVYYSQAWSLVWDEEELFADDFEAWSNGPVCVKLFKKHKGMFKVTENSFKYGKSSNLNKTQKETVDAVLDYYGDKDSHWLSTQTHNEQPWIEARRGIPDGDNCSKIITKASMAEYYGGL